MTDSVDGLLMCKRYLIHDRDPLFTDEFLRMLKDAGVESVKLPPRSPNLNAFAERWVRSVKQECLSKLILFSENSLERALNEFRNHQGKGNVLLFSEPTDGRRLRKARRAGNV